MRKSDGILTLVAGLGAAQAVAIVTQIDAVGRAVGGSIFAEGPTATIVLGLLSTVFLTVSITVTCVLVTGSTEVVLTGQVREIALRRLLGASAMTERARVARAVLRRAALGVVAGIVAGYAVSALAIAGGLSGSPELHVTARMFVPSPLLVIAIGGQWLATWAAVRRGTRGVLSVPPIDALRLSAGGDRAVQRTLAATSYRAAIVLGGGLALLAAALLLSRQTPVAMVPAVFGGVLSFVGIVSYAHRFVPVLIRLTARALPDRPAIVVAARALERHPDRTGRAVLGVAATVALVTTFSVGIATFERAVALHYGGRATEGLALDALSTIVAIVGVLTGFLAATAALALANAVSFDAWLRRRDIALFRVLGQSDRQTRAGIVAQSLLLAGTATVVGLALGTAYGWIGAQSLFGVEAKGHLVVPVLPIWLLAGLAVGIAVLTVGAAIRPARAALRLPPVRAYLAP